ncbi:MAG: hypothetical protein ACLRMJ_03565 [Alistipes finegoldii]
MGYFTPSKNLWDAFEEGDQRRDVTILYPGQHVKFVGRDITFGGYNTDGSVSDYTTGHVSAGLICRKFISPWKAPTARAKRCPRCATNSGTRSTAARCAMPT